jgi:hypothetical protein
MELTGDMVLDYLEAVVMFLRDRGLNWRMPTSFVKYPLEDQRVWLWNIDKIIRLPFVNDAPEMPSAVRAFMEGEDRPPITG